MTDIKEDDKWTHTYLNTRCKILINEPDCDEDIILYTENKRYLACRPKDLVPIKPELTKAEAWDKVKSLCLHEGYSFGVAHEVIANNYEVIDE